MSLWITVLLDGLISASYLFIVACGLTVIFGVMKILNVVHGSFYACGAYAAAFSIGLVTKANLPDWMTFLVIPLAAILVGSLLGLLLERGVLRFLYGRDEVSMLLATFALFLILEDILLAVFGTTNYPAYKPMLLLGSIELGSVRRDIYSLTLILTAAGLALACWVCLKHTRAGRLVTAVIFDREISEAIGINVSAVFTGTFVIGAILGTFGGAYISPLISVTPGLSIEIIAMSFAVIAIGGMGSIPGAFLGALAVGLSRAFTVHFFPYAELFIIYVVMVMSLIFWPEGIFSPARSRRI
jgi:branched-chain amino acid transport system permease protein